jgi:hypothetical protein
MIRIAGSLVNPAFIASAKIETRDYMNGSTHWLVVRMADGSEIRKEHGYGFNAFAELSRIDDVTSRTQATSSRH